MKTAERTPVICKLLEELEQRIAPATLAGITYDAVTLGNPQVVEAGQGISTVKNSGSFLLAVEKGAAMVFTTDLNGNNKFDPNEITGIAASDGLRITLFADVNGDIVTNLTKRFDSASNKSVWVLTDSDLDPSNNNPRIGGDGLVLLNSRIEAITLRSVTDADISPQDASKGITAQDRLVLSSYAIHGNILAGGGVGTKDGGISIDTSGLSLQQQAYGQTDADFQQDTILPIIGSIKTGTAAAPGGTPTAPEGQFFSFGYKATGDDATRGRLTVGGFLEPFVPAIGQTGGDVINVTSLIPGTIFGQPATAAKWRIDAILTGDGGLGARGGNIENVSLYGESGGLKIVAGDGGDGPSGGAGGSILNLQDFGSTNSVFEIRAGDGGRGLVGAAGAAGRVTFGALDDGSALSGMRANGVTYVGLGSGGAGFTSSGAGTSLSSGTVAPTDENGTDTSVGVFSSWRGVGEIPTQRMADFNRDGFTDVIYLTTNPDQIIMKFGTAAGIGQNTPTLYFAAPAFAPMTGGTGAVTTSGLAIADFNRDGWLDFAVGSSGVNSFEGIRTYLNPGDQYRPEAQPVSQPKYNGWYTAGFAETAASPESSRVGRNYIDHAILSPLPFLNPYASGAPIQRSGMPLTDLVAGNFDGDPDKVYDLAAILRIWKATRVDADRAWTSLVMLSGTEDGRFFADFEYDPTVGVQTQLRMPVLNGTTTGLDPVATGNGRAVFSEEHLDIALRSTAAPSHAPGGASAELMVGATLRFQDDKRVQTIQLSDVPGSNLLALQAFARENPRYFDPIIVTGSIVGWDSRTGTPVDITIADVPAVNTPAPPFAPPQGDNIFDILVVSQEKAVSMLSPLYLDPLTKQPLPTNTGIVLTGQRGDNPRVGGLPPTVTPGGVPPLEQPGQMGGDDVEFRAIVAGNFSASPFLPTTFSLLSTGTGFTRDQFISFYFPGLLPEVSPILGAPVLSGGDRWANLTYKPDGTFFAASATLDDGRLDANLVAFDIFSRRTAPLFFGVVQAIPTTLEDSLRGIASFGTTGTFVFARNLVNSLSLVAGDGGNSYFGSGGKGGSIGAGFSASTSFFGGDQAGSFTVLLPRNEYVQPARVTLQAGQGGDGFVNGGAGGGMSGVVVDFVPGVNSTVTSLFGGSGGNALLGSGGAGGSLSQLSIQRGINFQAGDGGSGNSGGAGGSLNGSGGVNGPDTFSRVVTAVGGDGGDGVVAGGRGGGLNAFVGLFQRTTGGDSGSLLYAAGRGGDAISGLGGSGGSIINSSPATIENFLVGPIVLSAGAGGSGLGGGIGGSISNFTNVSTTTSAPTIFSAVAGPGGAGVTRNGGAGGSVANVSASANGVESEVSGQFNRLVAGDGGSGFGSTGGAGGSVTGSTATASTSGAAASAGSGGAGLLRGGAGGSVSKVILDSTAEEYAAKIIVMAGDGGAAYAATANAPGVALSRFDNAVILSLRAFGGANGVGGTGGSIVNFTQASDPSRPNSGGVDTAVDLLAGHGGSLMNYGSVALFPDRPNPVGSGGSVSNVTLAGEAGRSRPEVAIFSYASDFKERVLRNGWGTQLNDSLGNVGIVAGVAGEVKDGIAGDGAGKNGSVTNLSARSIMSIVAGSVDRIAAVKTLSGIAAPSTGILGAYKTEPVGPQTAPVPHGPEAPLYFQANGTTQVSSPVLGGRLMDGAVVTQANPGNLSSARLFVR